MKKTPLFNVLLLAAALASAGLLFGAVRAEDKEKPKKRAASTEQLMEGIVSTNCGSLAKALKEEKVNWKHVKLHAAMLNESGYLLMDDSRCPSGEWANGAKALRECSVVILEKADKEDAQGVKDAFAALQKQGCAVCHEKHRKKD